MSSIQTFGTFGLPVIAIAATWLGLIAARRSAARIDAAEARAKRPRG